MAEVFYLRAWKSPLLCSSAVQGSALPLLLTHKQVSSSSAASLLYSACCFSVLIEDKVQLTLSADGATFLEINCA